MTENNNNNTLVDPSFALLSDAKKISAATDIELATALSNCLTAASSSLQQRRSAANSGSTLLPTLNSEIVLVLVQKLVKETPTKNIENNNNNTTEENNTAEFYFCSQQLKVLIATFFVTAARHENLMIQHWFQTQQQQTGNNNNNTTKELEVLVTLLLEGLSKESHSLVAGEVLRLFLQFSPTFLQTFIAYRKNSSSGSATATTTTTSSTAASRSSSPQLAVPGGVISPRQQQQQQQQVFLFEDTAIGIIAPMLIDSMALKNHSAWQVLLAVLQSDLETLRPTKQVVELLSKYHLHSFLNMLVTCLRHANPASRRFSLRLISDILQLFSDWQPISHCILQSPAIFFSLLANAEPPSSSSSSSSSAASSAANSCLDQSQVYHILKMFIMFPKKCPLMRHLCYLNRDSLGLYTQRAASSANSKEVEMIMSKLEASTPLTAEEAALIQCAF